MAAARPTISSSATDSETPTATSPLAPDTSTAQLPSDADRLAGVFRNIDTWVGEGPHFDVSKEFNLILFDDDDDKLHLQREAVIALYARRFKVSDLYHQFKFMVSYLEADKGTEPIKDFIRAIKQDAHWGVSSQEEFEHAWYIFWNVLDFHVETKHQANTFQGQIRKFFPPQSLKIQASATFSVNLTDLESVDLRVKPTNKLNEHLLIEGDTVKVFKIVPEYIKTLHKFEKNKAAKKLGIETLGKELLASLKALYGKDELFTKAEAAEIFEAKDDLQRNLGIMYVRDDVDTRPKVLAYQAHTLQRLVEYRRSWWPSLVRDVRKQFQAQPLFFYGAMLAVFFGVCTVIQTVTSVWSLVLALRAK